MKIRTPHLILLLVLNILTGLFLISISIPLHYINIFLFLMGMIMLAYSVHSLPHWFYFETEKLTTTGAYSICRHPRYFGACLLNAALLNIEMHNILLITLFIILWTMVGKNEEKELRKKFGKRYEAYSSKVHFYPVVNL